MPVFRTATIADIPCIRKIAQEAFPATYSSIISPSQIEYMMEWMYSEQTLRDELSGDVRFLLMEQDGEAVGYVSFGPEGEEGLFHLHKLYLLPSVRGRGYGRQLFGAAEDGMRKLGAKAFELNVNRHNKALDFYLHMGMSIERSGDFDIGGGFFMNDYILRKTL